MFMLKDSRNRADGTKDDCKELYPGQVSFT
jgi:hypothetical protein